MSLNWSDNGYFVDFDFGFDFGVKSIATDSLGELLAYIDVRSRRHIDERRRHHIATVDD